MEIAKIAEQAAVTPQTAPKTATQITEEKTTSTLAADNTDKYVKREETFTPAYTKKTAQKNDVEASSAEFTGSVAQTKADHLASLVQTLISNQASAKAENKNQLQLTGALKEQYEQITGESVDSAEEVGSTESAEEDYWGAEATAKRIFEFAKNLAGDNSELAETLKEAFIEGFGQAEKPYGGKGKLPSVCYETYDKVIDMFDDWMGVDAEQEEETGISAASATEASAQ